MGKRGGSPLDPLDMTAAKKTRLRELPAPTCPDRGPSTTILRPSVRHMPSTARIVQRKFLSVLYDVSLEPSMRSRSNPTRLRCSPLKRKSA